MSLKNWDNKTWLSSKKYIKTFNNFLLKRKNLNKNSQILDIGCGRGKILGSLFSKLRLKNKPVGIDIEIIDAQSLLPFDLNHDTVKSLSKTNRLLIVDEDLPGGASAYLMQEILENQNAYQYLDSKPATLTAKAHRPAYGSDGDYFSKPSTEDIFEKIYEMMHEVDPAQFKSLY